MSKRLPAAGLALLLGMTALAGCTAPAPQADAVRSTDAAQSDDAERAAAASQATGATRPVRRMPPLGGPLPPERVSGYCEADTDCRTRTLANGCITCAGKDDRGMPETPRDAPACAAQQRECRCVDHRCEAKPRMVDSPVEQAADEDAP